LRASNDHVGDNALPEAADRHLRPIHRHARHASHPWAAVRLTAAAAGARLRQPARAKAALGDFRAAVAGVETISATRRWLHPLADLAGYEPLFDGLRFAGVRE